MWKKGDPANRGRPPNERPWRDALRSRINKPADDPENRTQLEVVADQLIQAAADGDVTAIRELGDRLDGKPVQQIQSNVSFEELSDADLDARIDQLLGQTGVGASARRARPKSNGQGARGKPH